MSTRTAVMVALVVVVVAALADAGTRSARDAGSAHTRATHLPPALDTPAPHDTNVRYQDSAKPRRRVA